MTTTRTRPRSRPNAWTSRQARHTAIVFQAQQLPGQGDVAAHIEKAKQATGLQHVAQVLAAQLRQPRLLIRTPQTANVDRIKFEVPHLIRRQDQRQQIQQGALAATAGPNNRHLLTRAQRQRRDHQAIALATDAPALVHRAQGQHYGSVDNGTRYNASPGSASPKRTQLATSLWKVS